VTAIGKDPRDILLAPVVSEKSYGLLDQGKYTFVVDPDANKTEIRQAVEELFEVRVLSVNVLKVQPKPKRRGLHKGTRQGWKKAIVKIDPTQEIEVFAGAQV